MRFDPRTISRDRPVGKGRVRVNPSPGFVGDRGSYQDLHARRPKGLGGLCQGAFTRASLGSYSFKETIGLPINRIMHFYDPQQMLKIG